MKTVVSNSMVAHLWANQSQPTARNSSNTFYFIGTQLWSYGAHYLAAQLYTTKRGRVAVINSERYFSTTGTHCRRAWNALASDVLVVSSPTPDNLEKTLAWLEENFRSRCNQTIKRVYIRDLEYAQEMRDRLDEVSTTINSFRLAIGRRPKNYTGTKEYKSALARLEELKARWHDRNPPEVIEARRLAKEHAEKLRREERAKKQAENIANFRAGKSFDYLDLDCELLRIKGDVVETSGRAQVPLNEARQMLKLLNAKVPRHHFQGRKIGSFTINEIEERDDDQVLTIGCHRISLNEARAVLS